MSQALRDIGLCSTDSQILSESFHLSLDGATTSTPSYLIWDLAGLDLVRLLSYLICLMWAGVDLVQQIVGTRMTPNVSSVRVSVTTATTSVTPVSSASQFLESHQTHHFKTKLNFSVAQSWLTIVSRNIAHLTFIIIFQNIFCFTFPFVKLKFDLMG